MKHKHDVFLSYSHNDTEIMHGVRDDFRSKNLDVWTDENIESGIWHQAVETALENARCVVVLLSPTAKKSEMVLKEVDYARVFKKIVLPIMILGDDQSSVPLILQGEQYRPLWDNVEDQNFIKLINQIFKLRETEPVEIEGQRRRKEYLGLRHLREDLQEELYKAELNNDVLAFMRAQERYERDLKLLELELKIASLNLTLEEEFLLKRKQILITLKYKWNEEEANNNVQAFIAAQHDAEKQAWRLEDEYLVLRNMNDSVIEERLYEDVVEYVKLVKTVSHHDLRWFLLLRPERVGTFIDRLVGDRKIDPTPIRQHPEGGWEFQVLPSPTVLG